MKEDWEKQAIIGFHLIKCAIIRRKTTGTAHRLAARSGCLGRVERCY